MADELSATSEINSERHWADYRNVTQCALRGEFQVAQDSLAQLLRNVTETNLQARIHNDLGVLAAIQGRSNDARDFFVAAQGLSPDWDTPRENLRHVPLDITGTPPEPPTPPNPSRKNRVAIVSLLFNWPSTGGGTVHTAELARFLTQAGYDVRHIVICYDAWGVGQITDEVDWTIERLEFDDANWNRSEIQRRVRHAVDRFAPDSVIITDSWNFKPRLAQALEGTRYFLRLAAQECLCPLNNVRLLWSSNGTPTSCPQHQLATPAICLDCVRERNRWSGSLHRAERELSGHGGPDYDDCLKQAFANASGVLVVNPLIAEMVKPHTPRVHTIPSGFDSERFQWAPAMKSVGPIRILFAGLVDEQMKGFAVLQEACRRMWSQRQDFMLLATADPPGRIDEFTSFIGWQSQADLPRAMNDADIIVCPTIAEEALGRTAVEGMAAGRPVVASRLGGLPFVVLDEATGLLCEPGDPNDLMRQLMRLIDDADLREQFGRAGRRRFEQFYTWKVIIDRQYIPLLGSPVITYA